ncbi:MAG: TIGR02281 family clan AA aspartic protease [Pseudomonadota bacterium]
MARFQRPCAALALCLIFSFAWTGPVSSADVVVEALLPGLAVMRIDGQRVKLRAGESHKGITLVEANSRTALLEIDGKQQRLGVSQRISAQFSAPESRVVTIPRNSQLQYRTIAQINGARLNVVVDTGANIVALNAAHARAAGIAEDEGQPSQVQTAGSIVEARRVMLDSVDVGGIRVNRVLATVIDGEFPVDVLLGMSFLQHVDLEESEGILTMRARY